MLTINISACRVCLCLSTICGAKPRPDPVAKLCLAPPLTVVGAVFCDNATTCLWELHLAAHPGNNNPRTPFISYSRWFLDPRLTRQPLQSLAACERSSLPSHNNVTSISAPLLPLKCARKSIWILIVLWAHLAVSLRSRAAAPRTSGGSNKNRPPAAVPTTRWCLDPKTRQPLLASAETILIYFK